MFACVAVFGLATIVFGLSKNFILSLVALAALGAADQVSVVVRSTLTQLATPDAMRGRVSAVNFLFIGTSNELGEFESGIGGGLSGAIRSVVIGGVGTLIVVRPLAQTVSLAAADRPFSDAPCRMPLPVFARRSPQSIALGSVTHQSLPPLDLTTPRCRLSIRHFPSPVNRRMKADTLPRCSAN